MAPPRSESAVTLRVTCSTSLASCEPHCERTEFGNALRDAGGRCNEDQCVPRLNHEHKMEYSREDAQQATHDKSVASRHKTDAKVLCFCDRHKKKGGKIQLSVWKVKGCLYCLSLVFSVLSVVLHLDTKFAGLNGFLGPALLRKPATD